VGSGWYRCSITSTATATATTAPLVVLVSAIGAARAETHDPNSTNSVYAYGAMVNLGPTALTYVPTRAHNLCLQSQTFDNASWTNSNSTETANAATAPDGTVTADKIVEAATSTSHGMQQLITVVSGLTYTASVYVKAAERTWAIIEQAGTGFNGGLYWVNLSTGAQGTLSGEAATTFTITDVGNGWYRCAFTKTADSTSAGIGVYTSTGNGNLSFLGDVNNGIYVWGAQLELASSAGKYVASTTAAVYSASYDLPREWDSSGACQGLLVEEARTNLLTYSTQFDNAAWTKGEATVSANAVAAPDGTTTADKLTENTVNDAHEAYRADVTLANVAHTWSVYAKPAGRTWLAINAYDGSGHNTYFNLSGAGAVGTSAAGNTGSITALANGWYRCVVTRTAAATAAGGGGFIIASADNTASYAGDGSSGVYLWGAQLEAGAFVTSPIYTGSASVTRAGDLGIRAATSIMAYSQSAVTLYAKGTPQFPDASSTTQSAIGVDDATLDERHLLYRASANPKSVTVDGGVTQADVDGGAWAVSTEGKIAASIAVNDVAISFSGGAAVTDTSATMPAVHTIGIGNSVSLAPFTGHIKQIMVLPRAMTDAELVYLTTYGVATDIGPVGSGLQLEDGSGSFLLVEDSSYLIQET
jgi:hypothetical protein